MGRTSSEAYRHNRAVILAASTICHICGEPGSDSTDHIIPVKLGGTDDPWNLKPAHHNTPNSHGIKCNRTKSAKLPEPRLTTTRDW